MIILKNTIARNYGLWLLLMFQTFSMSACHSIRTALKKDNDSAISELKIIIRESDQTRMLARLQAAGFTPVMLGQIQVENQEERDLICLIIKIYWRDREKFLFRPGAFIKDDNIKIIAYQLTD